VSASFRSFACPGDPRHGLLIPPNQPKGLWFCPHHAHDGRPASHPLGIAPASRSHFSLAEAEAGSQIDSSPEPDRAEASLEPPDPESPALEPPASELPTLDTMPVPSD
jgi:hypothetical protein